MELQDKTYVTFTTIGRNFTAILEPDLADGGYVVTCKEIPAAISQGETIEEAVDNISDAVGLCLDHYYESANTEMKLERGKNISSLLANPDY